MANTQFPSHFYVDTAGELFASGPIKITRIIFNAHSAGAQIEIRETVDGPAAFRLTLKQQHDVQDIDLSDSNVVLNNGVYIATLTASSNAQIFYRRG